MQTVKKEGYELLRILLIVPLKLVTYGTYALFELSWVHNLVLSPHSLHLKSSWLAISPYKLGKTRGKFALMAMLAFQVHLFQVSFVLVKELEEELSIGQALQG